MKPTIGQVLDTTLGQPNAGTIGEAIIILLIKGHIRISKREAAAIKAVATN